MNLKNKAKSLIYFTLDSFSLFYPKKRASILMYHSIDKNSVFFTVKPQTFQKQMRYLYEKNYNVISLSGLVDFLKTKNEIPGKTIVLTFDDGYRDNYFNVFPVLKKYNFPATIFLTTGFIGKMIPNSSNIFLPALDWSQIKEMHKSGLIDFEPHTVSHKKLTKISLEKAKEEILESERTIEEELNKNCKFFAYPCGNYNKDVATLLKEIGFLGALTVNEGIISKDDDLFLLKRNSIDSLTDFNQFKGKLIYSVNIFRKMFKDGKR